jgi:hypothetical protein
MNRQLVQLKNFCTAQPLNYWKRIRQDYNNDFSFFPLIRLQLAREVCLHGSYSWNIPSGFGKTSGGSAVKSPFEKKR